MFFFCSFFLQHFLGNVFRIRSQPTVLFSENLTESPQLYFRGWVCVCLYMHRCVKIILLNSGTIIIFHYLGISLVKPSSSLKWVVTIYAYAVRTDFTTFAQLWLAGPSDLRGTNLKSSLKRHKMRWPLLPAWFPPGRGEGGPGRVSPPAAGLLLPASGGDAGLQ